MKVDYLVVGAGFTGAVLAERLASQLEKRVLVVDRRKHIGGNAYDEFDEHGIQVHPYGPHIFHTNSHAVFEYLSQFTEWRPYYHRVRAVVEGKQVPLPFSLLTLRKLFSPRMAASLERKLVERFGYGARVPILKLLDVEDKSLRFLAEYVYKNVFESYTLKQWGERPEDLAPSVTGRVPILVSNDERYFQDTYQAMPKHGYTALFKRLLSHPNIRLLLGVDWKEVEGEVKFDKLIYTGPIDEFFDYIYGPLPYRSLRFHFERLNKDFAQEVAVVNYPNEHLYTRVTEFKHITGQHHPGRTTLVYEYPQPYIRGTNEPFYPVPKEENDAIYERYRQEASRMQHVIFAGRLADYKYYNMDQAVGRALKIFSDVVHNNLVIRV